MGTGPGELLSIGAFARKAGLAPSALRFYDDCGLLRPARIDEATGYRFYHPEQTGRAVLLRRLRAADLPLAEAKRVLDGTEDEAERVLREQLELTRERAGRAREAIEAVLADLTSSAGSFARVGGAEFASAIRQVVPAAAVVGDHPQLRCVLIELGGGELRFVATDRYRLSARVLNSLAAAGPAASVLLDADHAVHIGQWARGEEDVTVEITHDGARLRAASGVRNLPVRDGEFPDYRAILERIAAPRHRVVAGREALRDLLTAAGGALTLEIGDERITAGGGQSMAAITSGPPLRIAFDPKLLVDALDASVGPEVLLEISSAAEPVVVRSADQGTFSTLVMPVAR